MNEQTIRKYIRRLLEEEDKEKSTTQAPKKKKGKKIKAGEIGLSVGRGGFTKVVADAGALAKKDPSQLMKNLEVKGGGNGFDGAMKVLSQAFGGANAMQKAYGGISKVSKGDRQGLQVSMAALDPRNGAKFMHHTLMGAMSAGMLSSDVPLQIQVVGGNVIVHTGPNKGDWE
jgi:hypothetical protein